MPLLSPRTGRGLIHLLCVVCFVTGSGGGAAAQPAQAEPIPSAAEALILPLGHDLAHMVTGDQWIVVWAWGRPGGRASGHIDTT